MTQSKLYDEEFEAYILGSMLNDKFSQYRVFEDLHVNDFYCLHHKRIFQAFKDIISSSREIELESVLKVLKDKNQLEQAGGVQYIIQLAEQFSRVDIDYYLIQVKELSSRRAMIAIGKDIIERAQNSETQIDDLMAKSSKDISEVGVFTREQFTDIGDIVRNYKDGNDFLTVLNEECIRVANGEDLFEGVRSYYPRLDSLISGFANGTNTIIGARSSSGKTTFLANLFLNISENRPNVRMGFFSLEMRKSRIMEKLICCMAGVNYKLLQERRIVPEDFVKIIQSEEKIKNMNLTIFDHSGININELKSQIRREVIRKGLSIVFIDYLSIIQSTVRTGNKHQEIDQISKGIQSIALELNIPMVTLSQLNRAIYARTDKTPVLADLRESGSIEEDADLVLLLHRPIHYVAANANPIEDITQLIVAKSRLIGDLGKVEFTYNSGRYLERPRIETLLPNAVVNPTESKPIWSPSNY